MEKRRHSPLVAIAAGEPERTYAVEETHTDARALPLGHDDQPRGTRGLETWKSANRHVRDELTFNYANVFGCCDHLGQPQIVMRLKGRPVTPVGFEDFKLEFRASPKLPPGKLPVRGVENPRRLTAAIAAA